MIFKNGQNQHPRPDPKEWIQVLMDLLMPVYGQAWERLSKASPVLGYLSQKKYWITLGAAFLIFSSLFPVPLRVVAPCEVVPEDPFIITAPLEGIVEKIVVLPGQKVDKEDVLFEYDKKVPLQQLEVAKKSVEVLQSELDRAATLGLKDPAHRGQYAILLRKLEKENLNLELAQYQANQLTVTSPVRGVAQVERPDLWRGKPVQIGEQVLQINDPTKSKVRIWIPESDNIQLTKNKEIKVFLNIHPTESIPAKIEWISGESSVSKEQVISFVAEASWAEESPEDVKLGLKGSAFLYGENVSLFYFLIRKPWRFVRNFVGL